MSSASVERIQANLENKLDRLGATPSGVEWCISVIDPFHDAELPLNRGFPDGSGMASVLQTVTATSTVSAPTGLATPTWDAHFTNMPWLSPTQMWSGMFCNSRLTSASGTPTYQSVTPSNAYQNSNSFLNVGGTYIETGAAGFTGFIPPTSTGPQLSSSLCPTLDFTSGNYRVVSQAFEVRSVGPDLYKSGTAYLWRQPVPDPSAETSINNIDVNTTSGAETVGLVVSSVLMDLPPATANQAQLIPSTVVQPAKEGCYVVSRLNNLDPEIFDIGGILPTFVDTTVTPTVGTNGLQFYPSLAPLVSSETVQLVGSAPTTIVYCNGAKFSNFDMSGAMFVGLNPQDVLQVTSRWIIQRFPTIRQQDLVTLARSSPKYDPVAIEAYSHISSALPVGVPVRDNSLGDWFRAAASVIGPALTLLPHPIAKAAGVGLGLASQLGKEEAEAESIEDTAKALQRRADSQVLRLPGPSVRKKKRAKKSRMKKVVIP